jgi:catechol 2,3-dioxygenase-like lactoylglutathione lyase family enzyme
MMVVQVLLLLLKGGLPGPDRGPVWHPWNVGNDWCQSEYLAGTEQRVNLVTLGVADIQRARAFYARLGWQGQEVEETVLFQVGGLAMVLWSRQKLALDAGVADEGYDGFGAASRSPTTSGQSPTLIRPSHPFSKPEPRSRPLRRRPSKADMRAASRIRTATSGRALAKSAGARSLVLAAVAVDGDRPDAEPAELPGRGGRYGASCGEHDRAPTRVTMSRAGDALVGAGVPEELPHVAARCRHRNGPITS